MLTIFFEKMLGKCYLYAIIYLYADLYTALIKDMSMVH